MFSVVTLDPWHMFSLDLSSFLKDYECFIIKYRFMVDLFFYKLRVHCCFWFLKGFHTKCTFVAFYAFLKVALKSPRLLSFIDPWRVRHKINTLNFRDKNPRLWSFKDPCKINYKIYICGPLWILEYFLIKFSFIVLYVSFMYIYIILIKSTFIVIFGSF